MFSRTFALMLTTVLFVQMLNFAVVLRMPPPVADVHRVSEIAEALRSGRGGKTFALRKDSEPPEQTNTPRALRIRERLAAALAQPAVHVRVRLPGPWPFGAFGAPGRGPPPGGRRLVPFPEGEELILGDYIVSVRLAGDEWLVLRPSDGAITPWRSRALLWLVIATAVVAPVAWLLARRAARPISLFAEAAERLGRDPRANPLPVTGPPEIAHAAAAFNEMQTRLNSYVEERTTLIAAIAHDLRTPLMRLSLRVAAAPEALRAATEADIRDMDDRIRAAMAFVHDTKRATRRQSLDLRSLVESVSDDFHDRGSDVALDLGEAIIVQGDPAALKTVFTNLIGNAIKYAGRAEVAIEQSLDEVHVIVSDRGPGMSAEDLKLAFEPFFRGERSRNRDTGGIGLGLASVRAVVRSHGGQVTLVHRDGGGLRAVVVLPLDTRLN